MSDERQITVQVIPPGILFLALTRPPIMPLLGLPHGLALLIIWAGTESVIITQGFFQLILLIPIWGIATIFIRNDYNAMTILSRAFQSKLKSWDVWRFGGASQSPLPLYVKGLRGVLPL
jgi:type IV secretory pathway VirB3-like protein